MLKTLLSRLSGSGPVAIPEPLWQHTLGTHDFLRRLGTPARARLRDLCAELLARKQMAAEGGLTLTAEMQLAVAAQACLPILNLGIDWYRGWTGIILYPGEFLVPRTLTDDDGVVHEFIEPILGEAWDGGPVLLSWADAQTQPAPASNGPVCNVVIHEFTHKLDLLNGEADGLPPLDRRLHGDLSPAVWTTTLLDAFNRFCAELDLVEKSLPPGLDPDSPAADPYYAHLPMDAYAATSEGEFFAVSSEAFFVSPAGLAQAFPDWYALLARFFRQDPLAAEEADE